MRRSIISILLLALVSACADTTNPTMVPVAGTFNLMTVNGAPLPYTAQDNAQFRFEVVQDTYTISDASTWTESFKYRFTDKAADTVAVNVLTDAGTYVRSGSSIHLTSADTDMRGSFDGTVLRFVLSGGSIELIYRR
jgi:predicted NAD/FAD-dependent oxidoreductase